MTRWPRLEVVPWGTPVAALTARTFPSALLGALNRLAVIGRTHENAKYLPGITLPEALEATSSLEVALAGASVVFMAVPSHGFRAVLGDLAPYVGEVEAVISLAKGIENGTNLRMSEVIAQVLPEMPAGVLTGPNLAREVAEGQPAASVVALADEATGPTGAAWVPPRRHLPGRTRAPTSLGARSPGPPRTSWP